MKFGKFILPLTSVTCMALADGLPVITSHPQSQTVTPGGTASFLVAATNATGFQWRFNGSDVSGATNSTLQITNAQAANTGYYMALVKNATGWVPSRMAYHSINYNPGVPYPNAGGLVPFSNQDNDYFAGQVCDYMGFPLNNCLARVVAGPVLDQMQAVGLSTVVNNGYYGNASMTRPVPTVTGGQGVYYRVDITDTSGAFITHSTVLCLTAGGGGFPTPSAYGLKFPGWWVGEGIEPFIMDWSEYPTTSTNQLRILGETCSLTNTYFAYTDYGMPTAQWRKDGQPISGATNFPAIWGGFLAGYFQAVLPITNAQPADAGIYDLVVNGNNWFIGPKTTLSIQVTNGSGLFASPRIAGPDFVCDLLGAAGRNYLIQWSSNLTSWNGLVTLSNATGTIAFSNPPVAGTRFYRAMLLP